jgi:hypothetical protein
MPPSEAERLIAKLPQHEFKSVMGQMLTVQQNFRKESQLQFYQPVGPKDLPPAERNATKVHTSTAKIVGIGAGNRASKTDTVLAEIAMCCTGIIPESLKGLVDPAVKLRGPIQARVVCSSLTTTLHQVMLRKLQYWQWNGVDTPGGERGHWGWIPRNHLIGGSWDKSWSEKLRTLRVLYRDPEDARKVGESSIQFMSSDQDVEHFASGEFHIILQDEPCSLPIWEENEARILSTAGRMFIAMTWSDDPAISQDWIHEKVHEPGLDEKNTRNDWIQLDTRDNPNIDQREVAEQEKAWSYETAMVRIRGGHLRFASRVHPLFTDRTQWWCFACKKSVLDDDGHCRECESGNIISFNHVEEFEPYPWPTIWLLDPHPRKPHMYQWVQVSPQDDLWQIAEGAVIGDPTEVYREVAATEEQLGLQVGCRLIDPNMGRSPSGVKREITWQDEFYDAGLRCDLADDSGVGRQRFDEYLKPDPRTRDVRVHIHPRCVTTISQMKRHQWEDHKKSADKEQKQKAKDKDSDHPALWKYLMNYDPTYAGLRHCGQILRRVSR